LASRLRLWLDKAGLAGKDASGHHLSLHGLRKALGRRLAEAGCSSHEVAAILGHSGTRSAEVYTRSYDRAKSADTATEKMLGMTPGNVTRLRKK
jgi:integrase